MKNLKIKGSNYFYEDINSEKENVIIFAHGHPFDHTMWNYQINSLNDFRLIIPDLKGYGKTDYKFDKIYIEDHALDLALLLDKLKIEKVHLIGLSMGGQIIVEFARLFPHKILSLVICGSNPSGETDQSYKNRLELINRMSSIGMEKYTKKDIHKYLHPDTVKDKTEAFEHLFKMMINTKLEGAIASHKGRLERRDNFDYLKKLRVPCLIFAGDNDFFTPANEMKNVAKQIPNSKFVIVPNAGHLINMEQPEIFNKFLIDFYKENNFIN